MGSTWLEEHIEDFIRPFLGNVPTLDLISPNYNYGIACWKNPTRIRALQAVWERAKRRAGYLPILLAGRDVWFLEVLARVEGYPTTFRSDISSTSVTQVTEDYSGFYCIDTGNKGSIPTKLKCKKWDLINYYYQVYDPKTGVNTPTVRMDHQIFSHSTPQGHVRALYSNLESSPKYWVRAEKPGPQVWSPLDEFKACAIATMYIAQFHMKNPLRGGRK